MTDLVEVPRRPRVARVLARCPWTELVQVLGVALVVAGVALVWSAAWAVLAAGALLLAGGTLAETAQVRSVAAGRKRQREAIAVRRAA